MRFPRDVLLGAVLLACGCSATHLECRIESSPALAIDDSAVATPRSGNPAELARCQTACKQGVDAMDAYCRSCPEPRAKFLCWAAAKAGLVACLGFCYNWWGT